MRYIFDLDGTLIDSSKRHINVLRDVLVDCNIPFQECLLNEYLPYKSLGNSTTKYLTNKLNLSQEVSDSIAKKWIELIESEQYLYQDTLYDEVPEILMKLHEKKHEIIYLTARNKVTSLLAEIERLGLTKYSNKVYVVSPFNAVSEKTMIIQELQNDDDTLIIGDTDVEYCVAKKLKLQSIILNRGFRCKEYWDKQEVISFRSLKDVDELGLLD